MTDGFVERIKVYAKEDAKKGVYMFGGFYPNAACTHGRIIQQLYENRVAGALSAERVAKLSGGYEKEQGALKQSAEELQTVVNEIETQAVNVQSFLKIVRKYTAPAELTPALLREFVEKLVVHAPDKPSGHRTQRIDVHYNFIGKIDFSPEYSRNSKQTTA